MPVELSKGSTSVKENVAVPDRVDGSELMVCVSMTSAKLSAEKRKKM